MKLGLNVGSGQRPFTSTPEVTWLNVDSVARPGHSVDLVCDGTRLPQQDGTADYFVLHHVLEHFGCGEADDLLREARRVLRPKGSLLIFVPDLRALAERWLEGGLSTQIYVTNLYGAYMGEEADRHKWGYDAATLRGMCLSKGWWPGPFDWRTIEGADIARDWWILGMECIK